MNAFFSFLIITVINRCVCVCVCELMFELILGYHTPLFIPFVLLIVPVNRRAGVGIRVAEGPGEEFPFFTRDRSCSLFDRLE